MSKYENYKYNINAKLNKKTDEYVIGLQVKGDYFESLMFAIEAITTSCVNDLQMTKKEFVDSMKKTYEMVKENK